MTYRKICIPETISVPQKEAHAYEKALLLKDSLKEEAVHRPEIVVKKNKYIFTEKKERGIFHLSMGKIITVTLLCAASFVCGCSVTNDKLAEYIGSVAAFSSGKHAPQIEEPKHPAPTTVYEKYMPSDVSDVLQDNDNKFQYLSAGNTLTEPNAEEAVQPKTEITVAGMAEGKTSVDGQILYPVFSEDLSVSDVHSINNQTKFKPDTYALMAKTPAALDNLSLSSDEPLVLVVHTHGTECYNSCENENFSAEDTPVRSENTDENVVGVGKKLVSVLKGFGIPAVHSEKMCDKESFVEAYSTSFAEVQSYLERYPSIRLVIDLHRDAIENGSGLGTKPVFGEADDKTAQLMFVVGTNQAGANHPGWKENLSLALTLQSKIGKDNPGLFRRINLRTASFNQQLSTGYMLLECGSAANTLEEAENAAVLFATGLARVITDYAS